MNKQYKEYDDAPADYDQPSDPYEDAHREGLFWSRFGQFCLVVGFMLALAWAYVHATGGH